ncbi:MAG: hypothetical protein Q7T96_08670 [Methylobacter sp.]|nr:hypothetical protein [Methylobacter sp.]
MNNPSHKIMFLVGLLMLFGQQTAIADNRSHSYRDAPAKHMQNAPPRKVQVMHRFDSRRNMRKMSAPSYPRYYKRSYRVNQLPHRHTRVFVNPRRMLLF